MLAVFFLMSQFISEKTAERNFTNRKEDDLSSPVCACMHSHVCTYLPHSSLKKFWRSHLSHANIPSECCCIFIEVAEWTVSEYVLSSYIFQKGIILLISYSLFIFDDVFLFVCLFLMMSCWNFS